jgi:hypothetical protein
VLRPEHSRPGPIRRTPEHQIARVEIGLRPDPAWSPMTQRPSKRPWMKACSPITTPSPISNVSG